MFCSKCGTKNPEGANYCSGCGARLNAPKLETPEATPDTPVKNNVSAAEIEISERNSVSLWRTTQKESWTL